jgi:hypothetical protein
MDVIKISFCPTNQSSVALYHILDDASVKLTLFQPPTVVNYSVSLSINYGVLPTYILLLTVGAGIMLA